MGLGALGMLLYYGAAYEVAGQGGTALPVVRALTDAGNASIKLTKFPLAVFILCVSLAACRAKLLPRWFTRAGGASAAVLVAMRSRCSPKAHSRSSAVDSTLSAGYPGWFGSSFSA